MWAVPYQMLLSASNVQLGVFLLGLVRILQLKPHLPSERPTAANGAEANPPAN